MTPLGDIVSLDGYKYNFKVTRCQLEKDKLAVKIRSVWYDYKGF